jgi:tRNA nucleotidyltransferase (CCA-adding enzyme)
LAVQLERVLPQPRLHLLKLVIQQAEARGDALYIVGGFVRDLLLGHGSVDFDLVVEGDAIGLGKALESKYGGRAISHRRFSTAKWELDFEDSRLRQAIDQPTGVELDLPKTLDFVTARAEFYTHPTALPLVQRGSIKLDLHRRDFTMNTLAMRLDGAHYGRVLDPWGGGRDLREGIIRVLHSLSFVDDPTRMLRAVRLEQRLGFEIESRTLALLQDAIPLLSRVSGERVRAELELIFEEPKRVQILGRLHELGLLEAIEPSLTWDEWLEIGFRLVPQLSLQPIVGMVNPISDHFLYFAVWIFRLTQTELRSISKRLRFSASDRAHLLSTNQLGKFLMELAPESPPSTLVARFDECSERSLLAAWVALQGCEHCRGWIESYLTRWRDTWPESTGESLQKDGLPPGPVYKEVLWSLREGWLDGDITSRSQELELLQKLIHEYETND